MLYIEIKESNILSYSVEVDIGKLKSILVVVNSYGFPNLKNSDEYNNILNVGSLIEGIINNDEMALYTFINNNLFSRYDNVIKNLKEEYEIMKKIVERDRYSELREKNLINLLSIGEELANLKYEKYFNDTVYKILFNQVLSSLSFEKIKIDEEQLMNYMAKKNEYVKKIRKLTLKKIEKANINIAK